MKTNNFYILITFVITLCLLSGCSGDDESVGAPKVPPSADLIAKADQLFSERKDLSKLREAIKTLAGARINNLRNYEVEWKFARNNYFLGRHTEDEKERDASLNNGKAAGKLAMQMEPNKPDGYFWYGANVGEQANRSPIVIAITSVGDIRSAMNKVIELQPDYELASAYAVLGKIELETRLMGGDLKKAVEYLEKSLALGKGNGDARLYLAQAHLALNNDAEAKRQLESVLQMKPDPAYLPEYDEQTAKAKQLLQTKF